MSVLVYGRRCGIARSGNMQLLIAPLPVGPVDLYRAALLCLALYAVIRVAFMAVERFRRTEEPTGCDTEESASAPSLPLINTTTDGNLKLAA